MDIIIIKRCASPQLAAKYKDDHRWIQSIYEPSLRLLSKHSTRNPLEAVDEFRNGNIGRIVHQQVHVIRSPFISTSSALKSLQMLSKMSLRASVDLMKSIRSYILSMNLHRECTVYASAIGDYVSCFLSKDQV